jgi:ribosomal protein S18 acetylase RimI-like enzyme
MQIHDITDRDEILRKQAVSMHAANSRKSPEIVGTKMGDISVHAASVLDFDEIREFHDESGGLQDGSDSSFAGDIYEFHENGRITIIVARSSKDGKIVGMACLDWSAHPLKTGLITTLLVSKEVRRCGVAQAIIKFGECFYQHFKFHQVSIMVMLGNHGAFTLYKKLGYQEIFDGKVWSRSPFPLNPSYGAQVVPGCMVLTKELDGN